MIRHYELKIDWLLWFLILLPTFYIAGIDTRSMQIEFLFFAVVLMVGLFHVNKWVGFLLIWGLAQKILLKMEINLDQFFIFFAACVLYQFIVFYANPKDLRKYMWVISGLLVFNLLWTPLQMWNVDPVWSPINPDKQSVMTEWAGWFNLPAFLGNYCAVVMPFCFTLFWPLSIFAAIGLWFSKSTFSILAAFCGILFFAWHKKRLMFWGLLLAAVIGMGFYIKRDLPDGQFFRRLKVWHLASVYAFKHQFFGHGFGNYGFKHTIVEMTPAHNVYYIENPETLLKIAHDEAAIKGKIELVNYIKKKMQEPTDNLNARELSEFFQTKNMDIMFWIPLHNDFLQAFFNMGLIGILIIGGYVFDLFRRFNKYYFLYENNYTLCLMSAFVAILIIAAGHFPFHLARLGGPFLVIMAFLDASLLKQERSKEMEI